MSERRRQDGGDGNLAAEILKSVSASVLSLGAQLLGNVGGVFRLIPLGFTNCLFMGNVFAAQLLSIKS